MPRTTGHLSELRPGVYRIRVSAGRHPTTGRRRQPSRVIHGTRDDAEAALQKLLTEVQHTPGAPRTFDELWDEWNDTTIAQRRRKSTTAYTDRRLYQRHIRPALGARHPADIRTADLNALYDDLSTVLSPTSVRKIHRQIGAVLHYGCRREYLDRNVGRLAEPPRAPRHHPEAPSHSDLEQVLNHMAQNDPDLWLVFRLDATVGVRRNELPALRYGDINFDTARIRIHQSVDAVVGAGIEISDTKTGPVGHGELGLDTELVDALAERRRTMFEAALATGVPIDDILIFPGNDLTTPQRPDSFSNRVRRYYDRHPNLPRITLRQLRTFVATELVHDGHGVSTAQAALRHTSEATTMRYYVAARTTTARAATATIGQRLQNTRSPHHTHQDEHRHTS